MIPNKQKKHLASHKMMSVVEYSSSSQSSTQDSKKKDSIDFNLRFWNDLRQSIKQRDLVKFKSCIEKQENFNQIASLKPRLINETLKECLAQASKESMTNDEKDGCEFIEVLMHKLHNVQCHFVSWDDISKSVVEVYIDQSRHFSTFTLCFLLRCYNLELIQKVFKSNLVDRFCHGNCENWHLMFVASYQERFFTGSIENIFEGFMCRLVLLSKLRCWLEQKRSFLTWFAGSLHLYADEYFLQNDEKKFKYVLAKLFEGLILNGLLTNTEYKNFYQMLIKKNEEMLSTVNCSYNGQSFNQDHESDEPEKALNNSQESSNLLKSNCYIPNLELLYPLSLKNICRLVVKRNMKKYTRSHVESLSLPNNLKKFVLFDNECDLVFKSANSFLKSN